MSCWDEDEGSCAKRKHLWSKKENTGEAGDAASLVASVSQPTYS